MQIDHGGKGLQVTVGLLTALLLNSGLAYGIVVASKQKSEVVAAKAEEESQEETFHCRYIEAGHLHQLELPATTWQAAEMQVCGGEYRDVVLPPTVVSSVRVATLAPEENLIMMAQRESCSCSANEDTPILEDIGIVEAPKLGTEPDKHALPRIANNEGAIEENVVNPDKAPPKEAPKDPKPKKDKKLKRDVDLSTLMDATDNYDPFRNKNKDQTPGKVHGSKNGQGQGQGPIYLQKVKAKLDNQMKAPASIPKSELKKLKVKVWIKIGSNGAIWEWKMRSKSGNKAFDAMVEKTLDRFAVGGSARFEAPPEEYLLKKIKIGVDGTQIR